ncbi:proline iminopeptidase-family hydrolase [Alteriqipengyuania sp.]|uniref:proline iminopeptidase-family hydrolase n=1 Tax=Alteriqipengyuania sp. TaxID=2800692 RepID=UPI003510F1ED
MIQRALLALVAACSLISPLVAQDTAPVTHAAAWVAPDRELMVPVEGGNVYVRINGDIAASDKTPAIFIHGGPGGTHLGFARFLGLADERPIILYDQLGSGKSDRPDNPANWRVERFVEELEAIRSAVGAEKLHLVGHSWGSAIALEYAARYPDHVASAVLSGTFISTIHWITDANLLLRELSEENRQLVKQCEGDDPPPGRTCGEVFTKVYSKYYTPPPRDEAAADYARTYRGEGFNGLIYNSMWGPSEFASTGLLKNYDATPKLLEIDGSRTLFLIGQYDSARIDTVQEFVALAPGAELAVVPGGAHGFLRDRPIETEAILRGWLQRMDQE